MKLLRRAVHRVVDRAELLVVAGQSGLELGRFLTALFGQLKGRTGSSRRRIVIALSHLLIIAACSAVALGGTASAETPNQSIQLRIARIQGELDHAKGELNHLSEEAFIDLRGATGSTGTTGSTGPTGSTGAAGATIAKEPLGLPKPASGWTVVYGDAFNAPLGTSSGKDNTWQLENSNTGCCNNSDEPGTMRPRQVSITPEGLKETCTYRSEGVSGESYNGETVGASSRKYECGGVAGAYCCQLGSGEPAGFNTPVFWTGGGQYFAFQAVLKLPQNTGLADPAFWADGPPFRESELDFPEFWGSTSNYIAGSDWQTSSAYYGSLYPPHPELIKRGFSNHPDEGFHTYTFYVFPGSDTSKYRFSAYIDGELQSLEHGSVSVELGSVTEKLNLILDYSLREPAAPSQASIAGGSYIARSVAIYEDVAHAGVGIEHGGLAPGTVVE